MIRQFAVAGRNAARRGFVPLGLNPFLQFAPPGHFYSPIPSAEDLARRAPMVDTLPGIDLRAAEQLALMDRLARVPIPFGDAPTTSHRYGFNNSYFGASDGSVLYALLQVLKPQRVLEVGSGFSTAVMLDAGVPSITCIEPFPDRLRAQLRPGDCPEILVQPVQDVPLDRFRALQAGDVLFIDSSHVAKVGSDVVFLLTRVLPILAAGVYIHVHDLFWPFDYPADWLAEGRAWNEAYVVHTFLQYNDSFAIEWFTSYLKACHRERLHTTLPLTAHDHGGSLYLRKMR